MASQMWYLPVQTLSFSSPTVTSHPMSKTSIGTSRMETASGVLTEAASRHWGSGKCLTTRRTGHGQDGVPDNPKLWGNRVGYGLSSVGHMPPMKCLEQILVDGLDDRIHPFALHVSKCVKRSVWNGTIAMKFFTEHGSIIECCTGFNYLIAWWSQASETVTWASKF